MRRQTSQQLGEMQMSESIYGNASVSLVMLTFRVDCIAGPIQSSFGQAHAKEDDDEA